MDERTPLEREGLLGKELSRQDARQAVRRMLAASPQRPFARSHRQSLRSARAAGSETSRYEEAFRKTERRMAEVQEQARRELHLASMQWSSLESHPPGRRLVMVLNDGRLHHWGLYNLLAEKSRASAGSNPAAAVSLAVLALTVAERLDAQFYGTERVADFRTYALTALGDARRRAGDFAGARLAFSQARINFEMGTGDLFEEANLLAALVSLLCDLGEYEKAAQALERANALYRRLGDNRLEGVSIHPPEIDQAGEAKEEQGLQLG